MQSLKSALPAPARTSARTAAAASPSGNDWRNYKAHVADVYFDAFDTFQEIFFKAESKAADFKRTVGIVWLIQSQ